MNVHRFRVAGDHGLHEGDADTLANHRLSADTSRFPADCRRPPDSGERFTSTESSIYLSKRSSTRQCIWKTRVNKLFQPSLNLPQYDSVF